MHLVLSVVLGSLLLAARAAKFSNETSITATESSTTGEWVNTTLDAVTGTGESYASQCNAAKHSWLDATGRAFVSTTKSLVTYTITDYSVSYTTSTSLFPGATPYVLCDNITRLDGTTSETSYVLTTPELRSSTSTWSVYTNLTRPSCTINSDDCARLNSTYLASLSRLGSSSTASTIALVGRQESATPTLPLSPICGVPTIYTTSTVGDPVCALDYASVRLLYWPVTTESGCNACNRPSCAATTMAPTITGRPNTVVTLNTTLTSPTVYIEFEGSWVYVSAGATVTDPQRLIIPQSAEQVSSYCGKFGGGYAEPEQVNYLNFQKPVPASVYRCQPKCFTNPRPWKSLTFTQIHTYTDLPGDPVISGNYYEALSDATINQCSTIWDDYAPVLSIPEAFSTIRPQGFQPNAKDPCYFQFNETAVLYDPPIALTVASEVAVPTLPVANPASTTSVAPSAIAPTAGQQPSSPKPTHSTLAVPPNDPPSQISPIADTQPTDPVQEPHSSVATTSINIGDIIATAIGMIPSSKSSSLDPFTFDPTSSSRDLSGATSVSLESGSSIADPVGIEGDQPTSQAAAQSTLDIASQATTLDPGVPVTGEAINTEPASGYASGSESLSDPNESAASSDGTVPSLSASGTVKPESGISSSWTSSYGGIPAIVINGSTIAADSSSRYVLSDSVTLSPGGSLVTADGTTYSLVPSGDAIIIDGKTSTLDVITPAGLAVATTSVVGADQTRSSTGRAAAGTGNSNENDGNNNDNNLGPSTAAVTTPYTGDGSKARMRPAASSSLAMVVALAPVLFVFTSL